MSVPLICVDIGNSRMKFGLFVGDTLDGLPEPRATLDISTSDWHAQELTDWLATLEVTDARWCIGSVNRGGTAQLRRYLEERRAADDVRVVTHRDLPLHVAVEFPERVGIDRLAGGVAANRIRDPARPAIVLDLGTALTVDFIAADGSFQGGAILPGIGMSARALHEFTDQLPHISLLELSEPVPALGTETVSAMRSGLFWGAIGAMRELIAQLSAHQPHVPHVLLTGGAAPAVAELLPQEARFVPHLVLSGLAIAADR